MQLSPNSIIHKMQQQKTLQGKLFIEPFHRTFLVEKSFFDSDMKKTGRSDHFPEETWFFTLWLSTASLFG